MRLQIVSALVVIGAMAGAAVAQDKTGEAGSGPNIDAGVAKSRQASNTVLRRYTLGVELAAEARRDRNALGLAVAAQMIAGARPAETRPAPAGAPEASGEPPTPTDPVALLDEAAELAGGNTILRDAVAAVAADLKQFRGRGTYDAGCWPVAYVGGDGRLTYEEEFLADEWAEVALIGYGDIDLDLWVYDSGGNEICRDTTVSVEGYCDWIPRWTDDFSIVVENISITEGSEFELCTN